MRIGFCLHSPDRYISGVEYYALGLLEGLLRVDSRHEYVVYTNQPQLIIPRIQLGAGRARVKDTGIRWRVTRIGWEHCRLPALARQDALDVLHCPSYICPWRRTSVPYVVTIHDTIALDHPRWCKLSNALYYNLLMASSARTAARVIAVSNRTAADLHRTIGLPAEKVRVIPCGIDRIFRAAVDPQACSRIRARYGLPDRYILHVGNLEPKKNARILLDVQAQLRKRGLPHKLVFVGHRSWRANAALREIRREAAAGNVVHAGYVDRRDLPAVYRMADVFAFPSLYEGFGFPPLEAMACGTPVVSSSRGSLDEVLGRAACLANPEDDNEIVEAVIEMIFDRTARQQHIEEGLRQSARFDWDTAARATLAVYAEVGAERGASANPSA